MNDLNTPALHIQAETGWISDPNGPFKWNGRYHVGFQYNPSAPSRGLMHWGRVSSDDLVHWSAVETALTPDSGHFDSAGCWSGSTFITDEGPMAIYTGVSDGSGVGPVCLALWNDERGAWEKTQRPALFPPESRSYSAFRDPFVFEFGQHRYGLVAAASEDEFPKILLYSCDRIQTWEYLGVLIDGDDPVAQNLVDAGVWEVPQFFSIQDKWVLVISVAEDDVIGRTFYLIGDIHENAGGLRFHTHGGGLLDAGHDFYAAAVLREEKQAMVWGWIEDDDLPSAACQPKPNAGALTFPRLVSLDSQHRLVLEPVQELMRLREAHETYRFDFDESPEASTPLLSNTALEITVKMDLSQAIVPARSSRVSLMSGETHLIIDIDHEESYVSLRRSGVRHSRRGWNVGGPVPAQNSHQTIRLFIDGSIVEVFVKDGPTFTEHLHRPKGSRNWRLVVESEPGAVANIDTWTLRPARS